MIKKKATKDTYIDKSWHRRKRLTIKQEKFIEEVSKHWNATEAASKVYNVKNRDVAKSIWAENLSKPYIMDSIEERVSKCKNVIYWIAIKEDEKPEVRIKAAQDVIDRIEWKPIQRVIQDNTIKLVDKDTPTEELIKLIKK